MLRPAFSTVACPDWTLERVAAAAADYGFRGVELRSAGDGGANAFASDPAFSDPAKVRATIDRAGVDLAGIATGVKFDDPVFPPVLGHVFASRNATVRAGKRMVDLAAKCGAPFVRFFAFQIPGPPVPLAPGDTRWSALRRICNRLGDVCDHARHRDLRVLIENAGDFASYNDLVKIIETVNNPLLGACYDLRAGIAAGDDPVDAIKALGTRLMTARLRDTRAGRPCPLGQGELPVKSFVQALAAAGSSAWITYEWDRAWLPELAGADSVLPEASRLLYEWSGVKTTAAAAA
ncbi:MAG: sugar phosphate isomerase/epimerase family protein [Phycisphaerales bacterium]